MFQSKSKSECCSITYQIISWRYNCDCNIESWYDSLIQKFSITDNTKTRNEVHFANTEKAFRLIRHAKSGESRIWAWELRVAIAPSYREWYVTLYEGCSCEALAARRERYLDDVTGEITTSWFSLYFRAGRLLGLGFGTAISRGPVYGRENPARGQSCKVA